MALVEQESLLERILALILVSNSVALGSGMNFGGAGLTYFVFEDVDAG